MSRTLTNTRKQVIRSGWIAWSSIAVMTLAFFVGSVFAVIAYVSHLYIQSIETRDNVLVFFEVGTDPVLINRLEAEWSELPQVKSISYTSEEDAYKLYLEDTEVFDPIQYQLLLGKEDKKLNSSLDIRLYSLDDIETIQATINDDIEAELANLDYNPQKPPIYLKIDDESINEARDVFLFIRISGIVLLTLLFVIIFFFILMTVEYRTYNRMEEIGVMQLVGGSLGYIRAPFILEGLFYGAIGAFISAVFIAVLGFGIFVINPDSNIALFIKDQLRGLSLPRISLIGWAIAVVAKTIVGGLLGALISYLAIRRYIK